jgi:HAD superfamily hydrolase (TIGR01509 family)
MNKNLSNITAVIFDLDGLLFDTERVADRALSRALADMGITAPADLYEKMIGRSIRNAARQLRAEFGDDFDAEGAIAQADRYFDQFIAEEGIPQKPGVLELLDTIDQLELKKAVASSSPREYVERKLTNTGIINRFHAIVSADEISRGKPAPDIFLKAAELLQKDPVNCLVLEDSIAGIKGADAAGMSVIMVPDIVQPTEEIRTATYRVCETLHDVCLLLEKQLTTDETDGN